MAPSSRRARALGLARRLAAGALQRLAREVDRLSVTLEPLRGAIPLREPARVEPLEVSRRGAASERPTVRSAGAQAQGPAEARVPSETPGPGTDATVASPAAVDRSEGAAAQSGGASSEPSSASTETPAPLALAMEQVAHLRADLEPPLALLRELAAWEGAEDPAEAVRRVRVATRRLRAFVRAFVPLLGDKRARKLERRLRAITRALGPLREHDVLLAELRAEHAGAEPLTRAALEHVIAWALGRRLKAVRRASEALAEVDAPGLAAALDDELDRVCGRLLRLEGSLPAEASAWLEPELRRAFEGMPAPGHEIELEALHDARIRAKRLRYAIELLRPTLPAIHRSLRSPLKRVQSTIGEHREAAQLAERLHARREALEAEGLHTLAAALAAVEAAAVDRRQRALEHAVRALAELHARTSEAPHADPPR